MNSRILKLFSNVASTSIFCFFSIFITPAAQAVVDTSVVGIYMDAPFVQASYANTNASGIFDPTISGVYTEDFDNLPISAPGNNNYCGNPTYVNSHYSVDGVCTAYQTGTGAYSAATKNSNPLTSTPSSTLASTGFVSSYGGNIFQLTFTTPQKYIGFYWSAGNGGNEVWFVKSGTIVAKLNVDKVVEKIGNPPTDYAADTQTISPIVGDPYKTKYYFGNPRGHTTSTPIASVSNDYIPDGSYVYIHAFASGTNSFDQIIFKNNASNGSNFELDNLTISENSVSIKDRLVKIQTLYDPNAIVKRFSFVASGGSNTDPIDYVSGTDVTLPAAPTRAGYDFAGWKNSANVIKEANSIITGANSDETFTAQWTAKNLTITYNSQSGSSISAGSTTTGGSVTNPGDPSREGYTFNGWFTSNTGGTAVAFPYTHNQTSDFTLYAHWTFIPIATDSEIQIDTADLNSSGEMVEGTSITIGGRATKTGTSTVVPDSSGTYSFSYIDGDGVTTSISNCQSMAMTNGISICEFTVPSGKSPYTLQNNFVTNDADYYLSSSRQSISRTVVKPPSSGGGGGGGAPAPTPIAVPQVLPGFTWNPKNIYENQEITEAQLGAEFSVPGTVTYSIPKGFKPKNGKLTIVVNFKPLDTSQYLEVQITREIDVLKVDALAVEGIVTGEASTQKEVVVPQLKTLGKVYFNTDEFFLDAKDRKYLKEVAKKVKKTGSKSVLILGHTDVKKGVDNEWLSKSRADAVSSFLKLFNIKSTITEAWYGPRKPAVKGLDKLSLAKNRRVEIYLLN